MTPDDFRSSLKALGITQRLFAEIWGCTPVSVHRWLSGERALPGWVPTAIRSMEAGDWWKTIDQ